MVVELEVLGECIHGFALLHVGVPENRDLQAPLFKSSPLLDLAVQ